MITNKMKQRDKLYKAPSSSQQESEYSPSSLFEIISEDSDKLNFEEVVVILKVYNFPSFQLFISILI